MSWPVGAKQNCTHNAQCNAQKTAVHFIIVCALRQSFQSSVNHYTHLIVASGLSRLNTHDKRQQAICIIHANEALQIQLHSGNTDMDWISCSVEHGSPLQIC